MPIKIDSTINNQTKVNTNPQDGISEDLSIDGIEDESEEITVNADEELKQLMEDQQICDLAARLNYMDASEQQKIFQGFLTRFFLNKKILACEIAMLGADLVVGALTKQPPQKVLDLFLLENALVVGAGVGGKIVAYAKTRQKVKKSLLYKAKYFALNEQISDKVSSLIEEQSQEQNQEVEIKQPEYNPYIH